MGSLGALGIGLSVIFVGFFLLLVAELYYLLFWKKKAFFNRRVSTFNQDTMMILNPEARFDHSSDLSIMSSVYHQQHSQSNFHSELVAKLYPVHVENSTDEHHQHEHQHARSLFTILEETKEDMEMEDCRSKRGSCDYATASYTGTPQETPFLTPLTSPVFTPPRSSFSPMPSSKEPSFRKSSMSPARNSPYYMPSDLMMVIPSSNRRASPRFSANSPPSPRLTPMKNFHHSAPGLRSPLASPPITPSPNRSPLYRTPPTHLYYPPSPQFFYSPST